MDKQGHYAAAVLRSARKAHAAGVALRLAERHPELSARFDAKFFGDARAHAESLLDHLAIAAECGRPALFDHQVGWLKSSFQAQGMPLEALRGSLVALRDEVAEELPSQASRQLLSICEDGIKTLDAAPAELPNHITHASPHARAARDYLLAVLEGRRDDALRLALSLVDGGTPVADVHRHVLSASQVEIGRMWQRGELSVAEEHVASRTTEQVLALLDARLPREARLKKRVLVTSANGDLHDIGLKMVAQQLELAGFDTLYLGASTPGEDVVRAIDDFSVDALAVGAKLTINLPACMDLVACVRASERGRDLPILVGGVPFVVVPDLWKVVGADASASHAADAVPALRMLLGL